MFGFCFSPPPEVLASAPQLPNNWEAGKTACEGQTPSSQLSITKHDFQWDELKVRSRSGFRLAQVALSWPSGLSAGLLVSRAAVFQAALSHVPDPRFNFVWIGLRYDPGSSQLRWADGSLFNTGDWAPWASGQPTAGGVVNHCVRAAKADDYKWTAVSPSRLSDCSHDL